jgi:Protein of unknown function (DUF3431)
VRPARSAAPALHLLIWYLQRVVHPAHGRHARQVWCCILCKHWHFHASPSLSADEATWIQERLGDITAVRIYQVEKDSERRIACQSAHLATAPTSPTLCDPLLTRHRAASRLAVVVARPAAHLTVPMLTHSRLLCADATAEGNTEIIDALSCWPHMASGSGREASVYLKYIIDEYDEGLADTTVFVHGHL